MRDKPQSAPFRLARPPRTHDELWHVVDALWGVQIPRLKVCPGHVAPFTAFARAYFAQDPWALWYGSRGTGKSYMLAILALTKATIAEIDVTLLGGSMAQSSNVREHVENLMARPNAPRWQLERDITKTEILFTGGNWIRPLPASPTTVRGPHPQMTLLDEIDEMEKKIYDAAMGQAMEKENARGIKVPETVVASSTWQHPVGTFSTILADARRKRLPVFTWCFREQLEPHGWMPPAFIERKRATVPAEMFRVEYELGEPAGGNRAFDLDKLRQYFVKYPEPVEQRHSYHDDMWVWEKPLVGATYAAGADWAKTEDYTVIAVLRTDVTPRRLAYLRVVHRKPWPEMIGWFNDVTARYWAASAHDATGLGNVVHDLVDERTIKVVMIGQKRTQLITEYIVGVENGAYELPLDVNEDAIEGVVAEGANPLYEEHRSTTVDDVYAPGRWDAHLNDTVAAMALAHRAAERMATPVPPMGVPRSSSVPAGLAPLYGTPFQDETMPRREGEVLVDAGMTDGVGVFWLPDGL